jgi:hypothetical protein
MAGHSAERAQLPEADPVVRVIDDTLRINPPADGKKHDTPATLADCVGDCEWQASAAADDRERTQVSRRASGCLAHVSSST